MAVGVGDDVLLLGPDELLGAAGAEDKEHATAIAPIKKEAKIFRIVLSFVRTSAAGYRSGRCKPLSGISPLEPFDKQ